MTDPLDVAAEALYRRIWALVGTSDPWPWERLQEEHQEIWRNAVHRPTRGSDVEAWLKARREEHRGPDNERDAAWYALDHAVEDYRLRADTGLLLHQDISEAGET